MIGTYPAAIWSDAASVSINRWWYWVTRSATAGPTTVSAVCKSCTCIGWKTRVNLLSNWFWSSCLLTTLINHDRPSATCSWVIGRYAVANVEASNLNPRKHKSNWRAGILKDMSLLGSAVNCSEPKDMKLTPTFRASPENLSMTVAIVWLQ